MAAAEEVSIDANIAAIWSWENNSLLKKEQIVALRAFLNDKRCFSSSPDWLQQE